ARAYRETAGIAHDAVQMAVVVQRMVDAAVAGVLFTADPLTGSRSACVVDAAPGPGTGVVDGTAAADHYVLDGTGPEERGCLAPAELEELRETGERLQRELGAPQDVEWAYDRSGTLWLLQSRPITTLFPAPPATERPGTRLYVEFGHVQGMLQPVTPAGMSALKELLAGMLASFGLGVEIVDIGGRLYGDLTDAMRDPSTRRRLVKFLAVDFGPRAQAVVEHLLDDPRFAPVAGRRRGGAAALAMGPRAAAGILRALARPAAARARVFDAIERRRRRPVEDPSTARELLAAIETTERRDDEIGDVTWPVVTGLLVTAALPPLLKGVADEDEIRTVLGGMPHNVTIEMDLALWEVARRAEPHRELLLGTSPDELAAAHLAGELPDFGLADFLEAYGHRCAAEVDIGVPRWSEDPAPVFAMLGGYLLVTDPEQAPDRRFERAAAGAEAMLAELARRARRMRSVRGLLAGFFLRRARELAGLREAGKFAGLYALLDRRRRLLLLGAELRAEGLLERAEDVAFLTLPELRAVVDRGRDPRATVAERRSEYAREMRRRTVPVALLSDGTDAETLLPAHGSDGRTLIGMGA
ncbi:PEP/pyruvate-binding domain-containing protein, partial [Glycomyces tenuis]